MTWVLYSRLLLPPTGPAGAGLSCSQGRTMPFGCFESAAIADTHGDLSLNPLLQFTVSFRVHARPASPAARR